MACDNSGPNRFAGKPNVTLKATSPSSTVILSIAPTDHRSIPRDGSEFCSSSARIARSRSVAWDIVCWFTTDFAAANRDIGTDRPKICERESTSVAHRLGLFAWRLERVGVEMQKYRPVGAVP